MFQHHSPACLAGLLGLITLAVSAVEEPPMPPGFVSKPFLSPKASDFKASLGKRMARPFVVPKTVVSPGFSITNISISGGQVTLQWQGGIGPFQAEGFNGAWSAIGGPTAGRLVTFPIGSNYLWRIKQIVVSPGATVWSKGFGGAGSDNGAAVAADLAGNVAYTGRQDSPNVIIISKYGPDGSTVFEKRIGGLFGSGEGTAIAFDSTGNLYTAGTFANKINFGGSDLNSLGRKDIFVVKFDGAGNHIWSVSFGASNSTEYVTGIAPDSSGNVWVCGFFDGGIALNQSYAGQRMFLAKLDGTGHCAYSAAYGSTLSDFPSGVAVDSSDNVVMTGTTAGASVGGSALPAGMFVSKYGPDGSHLWSNGYGITGDNVAAPAVDGHGVIGLTGSFANNLTFGTTTLTSGVVANIFVATLQPDGTPLWAKRFGNASPFKNYGTGIAFAASGEIVIGGYCIGAMNFGGADLAPIGGYDDYVANLTSDGNEIWSRRFGSTGVDACYGVAVDSTGRVSAVGNYQNMPDFGNGPLPAHGGLDIFLASFFP